MWALTRSLEVWLGLSLLCIFFLFVLVTALLVLTDKTPMARGRNANLIRHRNLRGKKSNEQRR